jgi:hypothetical protein
MSFTGHMQNGVVVFDEAIPLPEGTVVEVTVRASESEPRPSLWDRLQPVVGKADGLPDDASTRVDHYLTHGSAEERLRFLRSAASDCGVSLSNEALSSEGLYD